MIVANVLYLWPLITRTFKLGSVAQNTTDNRSQFVMHTRKGNSFNPIRIEERISGNAQGHAYSENMLDLTGKMGFSKAHVFRGGWENEEIDSDTTAPRIVKTVVVTQYRRDAPSRLV